MKRDITCPRCGKRITPEQIEIGESLLCPACDPKPRKSRPRRQRARPRAVKAGHRGLAAGD